MSQLRAIKNRLDRPYTLQLGGGEGKATEYVEFAKNGEVGDTQIVSYDDKLFDWILGRAVGVNIQDPRFPEGAPLFAQKRVFDEIPLHEAMKTVKLDEHPDMKKARVENEKREAEESAIEARVLKRLAEKESKGEAFAKKDKVPAKA